MPEHEGDGASAPLPEARPPVLGNVDVDVVILSWNRVGGTMAAVESVRRQTAVSYHVWLVDQGTESEGLQRLKDWVADASDVTLIENGRNLGAPGGRNVGFEAGSAPTIVCIDNDVELVNTDALAFSVRRLAVEPELAAIGFRVVADADGVDRDYNWGYPAALRVRAEEEFYAVRFLAGGVAFRRSALAAVGWYDDKLFFTWEESDLAYRLIDGGHRIIYSPVARVIHRVDDEARVTWRGRRYFYHVRNALYLDYKYRRSPARLLARVAGYLVRGVVNKVPGQAIEGVKAFVTMWREDPPGRDDVLSPLALEYIHVHNDRYEPSPLRRVAAKLFAGFSTR
jgi:GT2 family glycosyltransferase